MAAATPPGGKQIKLPEGIKIEVVPNDVAMSDLLADGKIDAMIGARYPAAFGKHPDVVRLFPNYREVERDYYRRTGIFPIMHTVVLQEKLHEKHRWLAEPLQGLCGSQGAGLSRDAVLRRDAICLALAP